MGNLIPVTEMKNVQKATKIPMEPRSDLLASLQAIRKCFVADSPGIRAGVFIWEKFPAWLPRSRSHRYFCKEKSGEARSRKTSQPGRPGSYEEAFCICQFFTTCNLLTNKRFSLFKHFSSATAGILIRNECVAE